MFLLFIYFKISETFFIYLLLLSEDGFFFLLCAKFAQLNYKQTLLLTCDKKVKIK